MKKDGQQERSKRTSEAREHLAAFSKAVSNPIRIQILEIAAERRVSPVEVARETGERLPNIAYHFKVLAAYGLIKEVDQVKRRGALEHFYEAVHPTILPPDMWVARPPAC